MDTPANAFMTFRPKNIRDRLRSLEVGESAFFPDPDNKQSARSATQKLYDRRFTSHKEGNGYRIFRVA